MDRPQPIKVYDSQSVDYHHAFQVFLEHTDQKAMAKEWLDRAVDRLPRRDVFIDAGAGNGKVTAWFAGRFARTIAIEPNPSLRAELRKTCPAVQALAEKILDAEPPGKADLVLCSHVLYYIDRSEWPAHLERMASWLSPGGCLIVVLQNPGTDCMKMLDHFLRRRFDLAAAADEFKKKNVADYEVSVELVPAHITTADVESAVTIAEFMLNLLPMPQPPQREDLEAYVNKHFAISGGGFRFSCHQDFLQISAK